MGDCKDQLTPNKDSKPAAAATGTEKKGIKDLLGLPKRKKVTLQDSPQKFIDHIESAEERMKELIIKKRAELESEKGQEDYNRKALTVLETMGYHLDKVIDLASEYHDLR